MSRLEELAEDWAEGGLDAQRAEELRALLRDPASADRFVLLCGERRSLRDALRGGANEALGIAQAQRRRTIALIAGGVALAAALLLTVVLWPAPRSTRHTQSAAVGRVSGTTGTVWRHRGRERVRIAPGTTLVGGDRLITADGSVEVALADTGAGTLGAHSDLSVRSAHALALAHGVLTLDLAPRGADSPFTLDTPHASCRVIGTRFTVRCDDLGSAVEVAAGSVQWQSDDAPAQTVRAGQSASAGAEILFGYDFTGGTVRQIGTFPTPVPLDSRDGLRFAEGGLLLTRNDFTAVHNPPQPDVFIDRLRAADAVSLSARVRFLTAIPRNVSIATLLSMAPEQPDRRFFPLRWLAAGVPAGRRWYDVRVTLSRDGHQRWYIDGQLVEQMARGWIFADWADSLALRIHTHQDLPEEPVDIVYARLRVIVH